MEAEQHRRELSLARANHQLLALEGQRQIEAAQRKHEEEAEAERLKHELAAKVAVGAEAHRLQQAHDACVASLTLMVDEERSRLEQQVADAEQARQVQLHA